MSKRYLHIGSWNIEHFSKYGGRKENVFALTEHIEMAGLDLLVMQELYITGGVERGKPRNKDLDQVVRLLEEHTGKTWNYELFRKRKLTDAKQTCGILWNADVIDKLDTYRIPVATKMEGGNLWDRIPHAVKFKYAQKTDFVVIPIHMKSNVRKKGGLAPQTLRFHEALTLVDQLTDVRTRLSDNDIIILGDTNCKNAKEKALKVFVDAGFKDLNSADAGTFVNSKAPFDHIFVPNAEKEFLYSRQYNMISANQDDHDKWLSDHFLVKTMIKIRVDDDQ